MRGSTETRGREEGAGGDFEAIFLREYGSVYRLLYRITGSADESDDLAQETFLRFHRHEFDPRREHNPRSWLLRVASNLAFNALRDRERNAAREMRATRARGPAQSSEDPLAHAERRGEVDSVRLALARIPERQARILLLRYSGLSYKEVAEVMDVAPGSVGTLLARAEAAFEAAFESPGAGRGKGASDEL